MNGFSARHDVGDGLDSRAGSECGAAVCLRLRPHAGIGFLHHLLAEIDAHQVVLEDVVVEHVLGGFAEVDDPFAERGRANAERHVLRIGRAGRVIVAADAADPAGDEVGVARVFALHEDAVAAKDRRSAVALGDLAILKIDLREDSQAADDPRDRIPVHLHQVSGLAGRLDFGAVIVLMVILLSSISSRTVAGGQFGAADAATSVPC